MSPGVPAVHERFGDNIWSEEEVFLVHSENGSNRCWVIRMGGAASEIVARHAVAPPFRRAASDPTHSVDDSRTALNVDKALTLYPYRFLGM